MNARKVGQKRHQHDLDGFEYVMRMPGRSRSGRKVKPKVYSDGTVSLVGCVDESGTIGKPLQAYIPVQIEKNVESPKDTSAEDCQSPMARDVHRRIIGDTQQPKRNGVKHTGGGIFKAAAVNVLREECRLMTTGEITKAALQRGFIKCSGKTPDATMASALYTDIKRHISESVFVRPREGLFGLREWDGNHVAFSSLDRKKSEECSYSNGSNKKETVKGAVLKYNTDVLETVGQTLGSTNGLTQAGSYAYRDGLIDLLSAAERVNNNFVSQSPKRKRRVLITAIDGTSPTFVDGARVGGKACRMPHVRSPRNRRKPQPDRISNEGSVGEKGSVVCVKQDNNQDICVQSPITKHIEGIQELLKSQNMEDGYSDNDLKGQLQFLRYCVQNPNDITRVRAEETLLNIEEALLSQKQRMSADETLNNAWKPQEDEFMKEFCNDEKNEH
jgi:hypothetical protein